MASNARTFYINGSFVTEEQAVVPVMDRGYLFADGAYEISAVYAGRPVDNEGHLDRLARSLSELKIFNPHTQSEWLALQQQVIDKNELRDGLIYIQVTRGVAERDFACPPGIKPSVILFTQVRPMVGLPQYQTGIRIATMPDLRWGRRDVKSIMLLAQVLAKREAMERGADDAWMVEDGYVTEGASSSAYIVSQDGVIVTRPLSNAILPGVTRRSMLRLCEEMDIRLEQRPFTVDEVYRAREAFITAAASIATPVVQVDGRTIGSGRPGPVAERLRGIYFEMLGIPS